MRKLYSLFLASLFLCFSNVHAQYTVNGQATVLAPGEFQLTPAAQYAKGSFFKSTLIDLNLNFDISLQMYFGESDAGADGIAFVLQAEAPTYLGNFGAGIGYHRFASDVPGPVNSFIVEFDTYQNGEIAGMNIADPAADHIGFMSQSNAYHSNMTALAPPIALPVNIEDGLYHSARFTWDATAKKMTVTFKGQTYTYTGDIVNTIFKGNSRVYWGCTSATGTDTPTRHKCKVDKDDCNIAPRPCPNDNVPPVVQCPGTLEFCYNACKHRYSIPRITATDACGIGRIEYKIFGATHRSGNGNDASGRFNPGTSTIVYFVRDLKGNLTTCTTTVKVKRVLVHIAASSPEPGCEPYTIYKGFGTRTLTLTANASEGTVPYTYLWSTGATTQSITVSPTTCTTYSVKVTDAKGCVTHKKVKVKVIDPQCKDGKVLVCHRNFGSGSGYSNEICISKNAVKAHLAHGDRLGGCGNTCHHGRKDHGTNDANHSDNDCDDDDDDEDDDDNDDDDDHATKPKDGGTKERSLLSEVRVQPNPSQGQFEIFFNTAGATEVLITNTSGKMIERRLIQVGVQGQSVKFDLSRKGAGMYLIRIVNRQGVQTKKIIVRQ